MSAASSKQSQIGTQIKVLAFFTLLTLAVTWPLILHLNNRVPGWFAADNYEYLWKIWWFKTAIIDLGQSPLFAPDISYPSGFALAYAELTPLHTVIGLPLTWLWGEIAAYNLFAMLSFILAAWASIYYAFGLLLLGPIYALARLRPLRTLFQDRKAWIAMGLLGLGLLAVMAPLTVPYLQLGQELELQIPLEDTDFWSASPTDYLLPPGLHPLWGERVRDRLLSVSDDFPQVALEFVLGVGFIAMLFAFYGWRRSRGAERRAILWLLIVAFVLSLGPRPHFGRFPVVIPAPEKVVSAFHSVMNTLSVWLPTEETYAPLAAEGLTIPLPALFLRWLLPPSRRYACLESLRGLHESRRFAARGGWIRDLDRQRGQARSQEIGTVQSGAPRGRGDPGSGHFRAVAATSAASGGPASSGG